MKNLSTFTRPIWQLAIITSISLAVLFGGCSKEEPATTTTTTEEVTTETTETVQVEDKVNRTQQLLTYMPESAQIAVAFPNLEQLLETGTTLAKRVQDPEEIDTFLEITMLELASEIGTLEAESFADIFAAKGIAMDKPIVAYTDMSPIINMPEDAMEEPEPFWAIALPISDLDAVKASIEDDLVNGIPELAGLEETTEDVEGIAVTVMDQYAYLIHEDTVVLGFTSLVKEYAKATASPSETDYGSDMVPAEDHDAMVMALRGSEFAKMIGNIPPEITEDDFGDIAEQIEAMVKPLTESNCPECTYITALRMSEEEIELAFYDDMNRYPALKASTEELPKPRFAPLLPEATRVFLTLTFNDELRKQYKDLYIPQIVGETTDNQDEAAQTKVMANQVIDMIGGDITLGVVANEGGLPGVVLAISLTEPEISQSLIQMMVPAMEDESLSFGDGDAEGTEVSISSVMLPDFPFPLSIAYPKDTVIASTSKEALKAMVEGIMTGESGTFFQSLDPPLNPDLPAYTHFYLDPKLLADFTQLAALFGGPEAAQSLEEVNSILTSLREIRMSSVMDGDWSITSLNLSINPEPVKVEEPEEETTEDTTEEAAE